MNTVSHSQHLDTVDLIDPLIDTHSNIVAVGIVDSAEVIHHVATVYKELSGKGRLNHSAPLQTALHA